MGDDMKIIRLLTVAGNKMLSQVIQDEPSF